MRLEKSLSVKADLILIAVNKLCLRLFIKALYAFIEGKGLKKIIMVSKCYPASAGNADRGICILRNAQRLI